MHFRSETFKILSSLRKCFFEAEVDLLRKHAAELEFPLEYYTAADELSELLRLDHFRASASLGPVQCRGFETRMRFLKFGCPENLSTFRSVAESILRHLLENQLLTSTE